MTTTAQIQQHQEVLNIPDDKLIGSASSSQVRTILRLERIEPYVPTGELDDALQDVFLVVHRRLDRIGDGDAAMFGHRLLSILPI
jgi:hypothetical protein